MSGYLAQKVDDLNTGNIDASIDRRFRMGRVSSPGALSSALKKTIIGQDPAVDAVVRAISIAAAGIRDPHRPIASLLFVGSTGVGKTELARQLAFEICGADDKLCRIDMNSLSQEHYVGSLAGSPPGYSGSKEEFTLFDKELVEGNASRPGIVLFDEVEKAHPVVLRSLLQVMDSGNLRLSSGTSTISFRNSIIIFTSNLGTAELLARRRRTEGRVGSFIDRIGQLVGRVDDDSKVLHKAVESFFDPEFYNRFDEIIEFGQLNHDVSAAIVSLELKRLEAMLAARGFTWSADSEVSEYLVGRGFDAKYGARNLKRTLRQELHAPIAEAVLSASSAERISKQVIKTYVSAGKLYAVLRD